MKQQMICGQCGGLIPTGLTSKGEPRLKVQAAANSPKVWRKGRKRPEYPCVCGSPTGVLRAAFLNRLGKPHKPEMPHDVEEDWGVLVES